MATTPLTREDIFLNAAATGIASNLPQPLTRQEFYLKQIAEGGGGGGGTDDYNALNNKPSINTKTLQGDMAFEEISGISPEDVEKLQDVVLPEVTGETLSI